MRRNGGEINFEGHMMRSELLMVNKRYKEREKKKEGERNNSGQRVTRSDKWGQSEGEIAWSNHLRRN